MLARASGAFAASSFGAGFGGSVWALTEAGDAEPLLERWQRAYTEAFPNRHGVEGFVTTSGAGLSELAP
jgi:galactokinase